MAKGETRLPDHILPDPEGDSERSRAAARGKKKRLAPNYDPETGEISSVSLRSLYNETEDERASREILRDVQRKGGFGVLPDYQDLDIKSLGRSVEENKAMAELAPDKFARRGLEQQAQHQDNVRNDVMEALERLKKG
jgi:hypothetical protein